ncbi:uncharacterized protein LOC124164264 [Ischnura elegans]|uniref:uncharacterized protein LOC124164264 n=1 Tax=Ischnura elegans TaxID=197161 RepID=UPI001ED89527|nr:uncharacterized protein LOC124164264 [Ischnura elegans]
MGPKPRKSDRWTSEKELKLIATMKKFRFMWDSSLSSYSHYDKKRIMYKYIASLLGPQFTGEMVKDRWINMKTTYAANYKRVHFGKNSQELEPGVSPTPTWHLYNHLTFLEPTLVIQESINGHQVFINDSLSIDSSPLQPNKKEVEFQSSEATEPMPDNAQDEPLCKISRITGSSTTKDLAGASVAFSAERTQIVYQYDSQTPIKKERDIGNEYVPLQTSSGEDQNNLSSAGSFTIPSTFTVEQSSPPPTPMRADDSFVTMTKPSADTDSAATASASTSSAAMDFTATASATSSTGDEWDDFGRMVAKILRAMPKKDAREVQIEFLKIIHGKS